MFYHSLQLYEHTSLYCFQNVIMLKDSWIVVSPNTHFSYVNVCHAKRPRI